MKVSKIIIASVLMLGLQTAASASSCDKSEVEELARDLVHATEALDDVIDFYDYKSTRDFEKDNLDLKKAAKELRDDAEDRKKCKKLRETAIELLVARKVYKELKEQLEDSHHGQSGMLMTGGYRRVEIGGHVSYTLIGSSDDDFEIAGNVEMFKATEKIVTIIDDIERKLDIKIQ